MIYSNILEIKKLLSIDPDNTLYDTKLNFLNEFVSGWIEELLDRDFTYKTRTQFYNGTGTQKLLLRNRPVFTSPAIQCWLDGNGYYGQADNAFPDSSALTYGQDFVLRVDQDNGSSRSAILIRMKGAVWHRPFVRTPGLLTPYVWNALGNIKVTYTAGWTTDTLPAGFKLGVDYLIAKLNNLFPYGQLLSSESYEERSVSYWIPQKRWLLADVWGMIGSYKNWSY